MGTRNPDITSLMVREMAFVKNFIQMGRSFEETERMIEKLKGRNMNIKFTTMPDVGHWISWLVYPDQEIYDWFLKHSR